MRFSFNYVLYIIPNCLTMRKITIGNITDLYYVQ